MQRQPFFKVEARPLGGRVRFFAQVATGTPCARPPMVVRAEICRRDLPRDSWTTVQVRLNPAHDASSQVEIRLNGLFCGTYQGQIADRDYGTRNGAPFINAQPRFGIYRDWRTETQTIYFDKILLWNADPSGHPDWEASPRRVEPATVSILIVDDRPDVAECFSGVLAEMCGKGPMSCTRELGRGGAVLGRDVEIERDLPIVIVPHQALNLENLGEADTALD